MGGRIPFPSLEQTCHEIRENYTILRRQALCPDFRYYGRELIEKGLWEIFGKTPRGFFSIFLEIGFKLIQKFGQKG